MRGCVRPSHASEISLKYQQWAEFKQRSITDVNPWHLGEKIGLKCRNRSLQRMRCLNAFLLSPSFSHVLFDVGLSSVEAMLTSIVTTYQDIPCIAPLVSALFLLAGDVEMDLRYRMAYER